MKVNRYQSLNYEIAAFTNRLTVDGCNYSAPNSFYSEAGMQYQCYKSNNNYLQRMVMNAVAEQKSNIHVGIHFTQNTKMDLVSLDKTGGSVSEKQGLMCSILSVQSLGV